MHWVETFWVFEDEWSKVLKILKTIIDLLGGFLAFSLTSCYDVGYFGDKVLVFFPAFLVLFVVDYPLFRVWVGFEAEWAYTA